MPGDGELGGTSAPAANAGNEHLPLPPLPDQPVAQVIDLAAARRVRAAFRALADQGFDLEEEAGG